MERYRAVDAVSRTPIGRALIVAVLALCCSFCALAQQSETTRSLKQLVDAKLWSEAVSRCELLSSHTPDDDYSCGMAFANAGRLDDARAAFLRGATSQPTQSRFFVELAGLEFLEKRYSKAADWMLRAERISPGDHYINDFLGTVFFLQGELEAALKYWNRVDKPKISKVQFEPSPSLDPVLLDRAISIVPGAILTREDVLATRTRLRMLEVFSNPSLQLRARADGTYDLWINARERSGFGRNKYEALLSTFGGVFFETVTPSYSNIENSSAMLRSLWRWDSEKRRIAASYSAPLHRKANWRYRVGLDLRNENWSVFNFSSLPQPSLGALNMRRSAGFVEINSAPRGRWTWQAAAEFSHRDFRSVTVESATADSPLRSDLVVNGYALKQTLQTNYSFVRLPERRYFANVFAISQVGRVWPEHSSDAAVDSHSFLKLQAGLKQDWSSNASADYEASHLLRAGKTFGTIPFDELFLLGVERDNDLLMRAHVGTHHGRKGSAPLGRNYFVSNFDANRKLWSNGMIAVRLGPFVDTGKITDSIDSLGTQKWLLDAGGQLKVQVLGFGVGLSYGRDLRAGKGAFYAFVMR